MPHPDDPHLFPLKREPASFWERTGIGEKTERRLNIGLVALVALFVGGWTWGIKVAIEENVPLSITNVTNSALSENAPPPAAFLLDELVRSVARPVDWRGRSGALRVRILEPGDTVTFPDSLPPEIGAELAGAEDDTTARHTGATPPPPGIWDLVLRAGDAARRVPGFTFIVPVPMTEKRGGRIGTYRLGSWPFEGRTARPGYETPAGLIRVTPQNRDLAVSEHFVLGDFLTKGQDNVWPKYVVVSPRMLDKLELTIQELERRGHRVDNVGVISGFRHPDYNAGGGNTAGRGDLSRHMYGDATDFFVDNDDDFAMDDLNGDGRVTVADARVMADAAEQVERDHPELIGGIGIYRPTGAHQGFIHVDTRGYRARW